MYKHDVAFAENKLSIPLLGQFDLDGLGVLGHQFDSHSRSGGENILHSGLKLLGICPESIEF